MSAERKWVIALVAGSGCALLAPFVLVALGVAVWLAMLSAARPPNQGPAPAPAAAPGPPAEAPRASRLPEEFAPFPINAEKDPLAAALERLGLWNPRERRKLEVIDPDRDYAVAHLNVTGRPVGTYQVKGQRLRDAVALAEGHKNESQLDAGARRLLNQALYGTDEKPDDADRLGLGVGKLREALLPIRARKVAEIDVK